MWKKRGQSGVLWTMLEMPIRPIWLIVWCMSYIFFLLSCSFDLSLIKLWKSSVMWTHLSIVYCFLSSDFLPHKLNAAFIKGACTLKFWLLFLIEHLLLCNAWNLPGYGIFFVRNNYFIFPFFLIPVVRLSFSFTYNLSVYNQVVLVRQFKSPFQSHNNSICLLGLYFYHWQIIYNLLFATVFNYPLSERYIVLISLILQLVF